MAVVLFLLEQRHFIFLTNSLLFNAQIVKCTFQAGLLLKCHNALRNDNVTTSHMIFGIYLNHQRSLHKKKWGVGSNPYVGSTPVSPNVTEFLGVFLKINSIGVLEVQNIFWVIRMWKSECENHSIDNFVTGSWSNIKIAWKIIWWLWIHRDIQRPDFFFIVCFSDPPTLFFRIWNRFKFPFWQQNIE